MDVHRQAAVALSFHGTKREGPSIQVINTKRARCNDIHSSHTGDDPYASQDEHSDTSHSAEGNRLFDSAATTPLTPLSPKVSYPHPSDLNKVHQCTFGDCSKAFNRPAKLVQHIRSHTNTRPFTCPHAPCSKDFLREAHLKHHIKSAHSTVRDFECGWEGCNKSFVTSTRLRRHRSVHEGENKFICTTGDCGQRFRKHSTMQMHVTKIHQGKKPFICAFLGDEGKKCDAGFDTSGQLKSHEGRIHQRKTFLCTICSSNLDDQDINREATFATYATLQQHTAIEHPPTCSQCGLKRASQAALRSHIEVQHGHLSVDDRKIHVCPEAGCGAAFTKKGNLNVHVQAAHYNKRYVCGSVNKSTLKNAGDLDGFDGCGMPLTTKANLVEHIRTTHLGFDSKSKGKAQKKEKQVRIIESTVVSRLTGSGFKEESGSNIRCAIRGCEYRFSRKYDHEIHLQARHGLADFEIQTLQAAKPWETTFARPELRGSTGFATIQDLDAERALDVQFGDNAEMESAEHQLEAGALRGDDFWLGEQAYGMTGNENEWLRDEMEMQQLIEDIDNAGQDMGMIDPGLQ